jgi:hypothetical protein
MDSLLAGLAQDKNLWAGPVVPSAARLVDGD